VALATASVPALWAQGAISTQGFGYPGGQLSTRALGTGGALADFDPNSPLNPAALVLGARGSVYMQYDPEFRSVTSAGGNISSTTSRFPVLGVTGRFRNATFGLSFSNLLDRSWTNAYTDTQTVSGRLVESHITAQSTGGISDIRAALSYRITDRLHLGLGVHVFPGQNRTLLGRNFDDSLKIGGFTEASLYNFTGSAVSFGVLAVPLAHLSIGVSARLGGNMTMRNGDSTVVGSATVPSRWSVSGAYEGFAGSALSVRYGSERWSSMKGLGSAGLGIHDTNELDAGVEFGGPKVASIASAVRLGYRSRDLPFSPGADPVAERSLVAGVGVPLAAGRGVIDLSLAHARRTIGTLSETGWILSLGFAIKP
jgi:hypothetical protein